MVIISINAQNIVIKFLMQLNKIKVKIKKRESKTKFDERNMSLSGNNKIENKAT